MSQRHDRCYNLAQDWIKWLDTRKFFNRPDPKNILAMLQQQGTSRGEPDGKLSVELNAFNLCVKAEPNEYLIPFLFVYCHASEKPAKVYAADLSISVPSFYERAHKAATSIYRKHLDLVDLHHKMQREIGMEA
jgi:hypothetical protein